MKCECNVVVCFTEAGEAGAESAARKRVKKEAERGTEGALKIETAAPSPELSHVVMARWSRVQ